MSKGFIEIDQVRCKGCGLCIVACRPNVIRIAEGALNSKGYHPAEYADPDESCTGCAACAMLCPDVCISVYRRVNHVVHAAPVRA